MARMNLIAQFQLEPNSYIDRNYFMRVNKVETQDSRFNIFETDNLFEFFDDIKGPEWVGQKYFRTENQ